jgi:predicted esterase
MAFERRVALLSAVLTWGGSCAPLEGPRDAARPEPLQTEAAGAGPQLAVAVTKPQAAQQSGFSSLEVPGFLPAVLFTPPGDNERPVLVAAHGAGGSPDWECEYWRRLTRARAFVLCLRGTAMGGDSFYYKNHYALRDELAAALGAARARAPRMASRGGIYAGFSQGASMGSLVVATRAAQLPYVVLIEGFEQWNIALGRSFARQGGKSVLFVCGTAQCATKAAKSESALRQTSVRGRAKHAVGAGHTPVGPVEDAVAENLPWLLEGEALWQ